MNSLEPRPLFCALCQGQAIQSYSILLTAAEQIPIHQLILPPLTVVEMYLKSEDPIGYFYPQEIVNVFPSDLSQIFIGRLSDMLKDPL